MVDELTRKIKEAEEQWNPDVEAERDKVLVSRGSSTRELGYACHDDDHNVCGILRQRLSLPPQRIMQFIWSWSWMMPTIE